jgi:hypothetical protein
MTGERKMKARAVLCSCLAIVLSGTPAICADISGSGLWRSQGADSIRGTWSATLKRTGDVVRGTFEIDGSNVFRRGAVEGTISNGQLVIGIVAEGEHVASFTGTLSKDGAVTGEWESEALADGGVWDGTLRAGGEPSR